MILVAASRVPWRLAALFQFHQHLPGDFLQGLKYALALEGHSFEHWFVFAAKFFGEGINGQNIGQVALIQLQDIRNLVEVVAVLFQVGHQVVERLGISIHALLLGVGHKYNPVHTAQNQLSAGIVKNLSGNRVEMNAGLEAAYRAEIQAEENQRNRVRSVSVASEIILPFCCSAVFW